MSFNREKFRSREINAINRVKILFFGKKGELTRYNWRRMHGDAIISRASNVNRQGKYIELDTMLQVLLMHKEHMEACGVETIYLTLNFFCKSDIASWHLEHEQLEKIVNLGSGLSLDWYQFDEDEELDDKEKV